MPFYEILETIAEIFIQEQDDARQLQINRLESEVTAIDVKITAKQKELLLLQKSRTDKTAKITNLKTELSRNPRKPLPASRPKTAPESTAPSPAATPTPSAL